MKNAKTSLLMLSMLLTMCLGTLNAAVFIMYHRVGDSTYPSTNVTQRQFNQQMAYLATEHFHVWPATKIISYLRAGQKLPPKTVGIMFDDAYDSVYHNAWPILKKHHFPFALFVATDPIDRHFKGMLTWQQIKFLAEHGTEIGNHSVMHAHMATLNPHKMNAEVTKAQQRLKAEVGVTPKLFAYPYGEYSHTLVAMIKPFHFIAAFTQTSGAIDSQSDFYRLPRFPLNEDYADFDRFKDILMMQPLHVIDVQPSEILLRRTPKSIQFTLGNPSLNTKQLNCFFSGQALSLNKQHLPFVQIRLNIKFVAGRNKINCTAPDAHGHWHWLGLLYLVN